MPIDDNDKKEIRGLIAEAFKTQQAEQANGIAAAIKAGLDGLKLDEKFSALDEKFSALDEKPGEKKDEKPGESSPKLEELPAFRRMQAQLEASEKARKEAEDARNHQRLTQATREALVAAGVPEAMAGYALASLERDGTIKLNEAGDPVFVMPGQFGGTEEMAAAEGAKAFLKTDAGAVLLPPKDTGGSGQRQRSTKAPTTQTGQVDWDALGQRVDGSRIASVLDS